MASHVHHYLWTFSICMMMNMIYWPSPLGKHHYMHGHMTGIAPIQCVLWWGVGIHSSLQKWDSNLTNVSYVSACYETNISTGSVMTSRRKQTENICIQGTKKCLFYSIHITPFHTSQCMLAWLQQTVTQYLYVIIYAYLRYPLVAHKSSYTPHICYTQLPLIHWINQAGTIRVNLQMEFYSCLHVHHLHCYKWIQIGLLTRNHMIWLWQVYC